MFQELDLIIKRKGSWSMRDTAHHNTQTDGWPGYRRSPQSRLEATQLQDSSVSSGTQPRHE